jgi:hypothetical protein
MRKISTTIPLLIGTAMLVFSQRPLRADILNITFETLPDGTPIADGTPLTTQFPTLTFTNATVITAGISLNEFEFPPHSGTNVAFDDGGPISVAFASPVLSFGGFFTYLEPITLTAFDVTGTKVASALSAFSTNDALYGDPGSSPNEFLSVAFSGGVADVTIMGDIGGSSFTMDDLTYNSAVPEPCSAVLLLSGLALSLLRKHMNLNLLRP